jgi:hypothetical protein
MWAMHKFPILGATLLISIGLVTYFWSLPDEKGLEYVALCDALAGDPDDPNKVTVGIPIKDLEFDKAYDACSKAYQSRSANARINFQLGRLYLIKKNYEKAHELFANAADSKYAAAQFQIGRMIFNELVVGEKRDAIDWFRRAAQQGHIPAMVSFAGEIAAFSDRTDADNADALRWASEAAAAGNSGGQFILGAAYLEGMFGEKNKELALHWITESANQDHIVALFTLIGIWRTGSLGVKNNEKAIFYSKKIIELSIEKELSNLIVGSAAYVLGKSYFTGDGVIQDIEAAKKWLNRSAELGYESAIQELRDIE